MIQGKASLSGNLALKVIKPPKAPLSWRIRNKMRWGFIQGYLSVKVARLVSRYLAVMTATAELKLRVIKANGDIIDYGTVGYRVVTTAGVGYIVDAFQDSVELEDMKYHGIGTDNTAENVSDTDLNTEITTEYQTNNTRATGTTAEGSSANIYQTVATNTVDSAVAIVEHGVLSNATVGSGVLLDRTVFSAINLANGDSLQSTYELTLTAGS